MTHRVIAPASIPLSDAAQENLNDFLLLFMKWNRSINLSGARTEEQLQLHIIDCLHAVPHLRSLDPGPGGEPSSAPPRVLDVGAGGGLPSVVAAICLPRIHLTALEPVHKKCSFLRTAARELSLANFVALAERLDHHQVHDYDAAMSRATFDLREWLLLGQSYVRAGGVVLGFEAVPRPDLPEDTQRHSYSLEDKTRSIVVLRRPAS